VRECFPLGEIIETWVMDPDPVGDPVLDPDPGVEAEVAVGFRRC
jgi:hypothetical protein